MRGMPCPRASEEAVVVFTAAVKGVDLGRYYDVA
jgi:hypothetical protein